MAPEVSATKRAYDEIKRRILDGALLARTRLDTEDLGRELGLSSMPIRVALNLLMWEGLVRPGQHTAYEVTLWPAAELINLYEWRASLLGLVLPISAAGSEIKRIARTQPYADAVFQVMRKIEEGANAEIRRAAVNADERLHAARRVEPEVLGDAEGEFEMLVDAIAARSRRLRALLKSYQSRRIQHAVEIRERVALRALPTNGSP